MNTFVRKLVKQLPAAVESINKELVKEYAIDYLTVQVSNNYHLYQAQCTDEITGFQVEYGDDWDDVLSRLTKKLTLRKGMRKAMIAKACKMIADLEKED